jgi:hypothetical protein
MIIPKYFNMSILSLLIPSKGGAVAFLDIFPAWPLLSLRGLTSVVWSYKPTTSSGE